MAESDAELLSRVVNRLTLERRLTRRRLTAPVA